MNAPRGRGYWAVVPFSPEPPFRLYAEGSQPRRASTAAMVNAVKAGMSTFDVLVEVKMRPILVITGALAPRDEVLALRLRRFGKLTTSEQGAVRGHADDALFHLDRARFAGLPEENAAIISAPVRVPLSAVDTSTELGALNVDELRVVHERVARAHGLQLDTMILQRAQRLIERVQDENS